MFEDYTYLKMVHTRLQDPSTSGYQILYDWSKICQRVFQGYILMIWSTAILMLFFPIVYYWLTGDVELIVPIFVPWIDETTILGFIQLQMVHIFWWACGTLGLVGSDLSCIMFALYTWPLTNLFNDHLDKLNKSLIQNPKWANTREMRLYVRNLALLHQELCE